jgi:hypothetical protein
MFVVPNNLKNYHVNTFLHQLKLVSKKSRNNFFFCYISMLLLVASTMATSELQQWLLVESCKKEPISFQSIKVSIEK